MHVRARRVVALLAVLGGATLVTGPTAQETASVRGRVEIGVGMGWATAALVYVALAYFTFLYRWPPLGEQHES